MAVLGTLLLWYLLLKATLCHDTETLPKSYEVARYYILKVWGEVDTSNRWPGWDGWYFFVIPDDQQIPVKMVRASLMTRLYGLG